MTDRQTPKALLTTDRATLIDIIEIHNELRKEAKRKMNAGVHGKKVVE